MNFHRQRLLQIGDKATLPERLNYAVIIPDSLLSFSSTYLAIAILLCFLVFIYTVTIVFDRRRQTCKGIRRFFWITGRLVGIKPPVMEAING